MDCGLAKRGRGSKFGDGQVASADGQLLRTWEAEKVSVFRASFEELTVTHMRRKDLKLIKIPGCTVVAGFRRRARMARIGGGAPILLRAVRTATSDGIRVGAINQLSLLRPRSSRRAETLRETG